MKFLILCRAPHLYSCQRLKEVAEARGHNIDILDPNRCILKLEENPPHFQIYYQDNWGDKPRLLSDYDGVIPRFGPTSTQMGCAVLTHYQGKGVYCLNDAQSFLLARDKWQSLQHLMQNEIPIPTSLFWGEEVQIGEMREQLSMPTILKTLSGSQGVGVMLAERRQSAVSILETFKQHRIPVLAQNFIEEAGNADIRCFVIGHQVVATMQRKGQEGEFRANCHRGGKAEEIILNEEEKNIAIRAAQTMGLVVAGVDLIRSNHGLLVLEVNASPGLEMIEKTSQIDLALQMILYLETQIETRRVVISK